MAVYHTVSIIHCRCVKKQKNEFLIMFLYKRIIDYNVS